MHESEWVAAVMQTRVLLWRNFHIFSRKKKIIMFMLLTPLMICLMLSYMADIIEFLKYEGVGNRDVELVGKMHKCKTAELATEPCATVGYSIIGDKRRDRQGKY